VCVWSPTPKFFGVVAPYKKFTYEYPNGFWHSWTLYRVSVPKKFSVSDLISRNVILYYTSIVLYPTAWNPTICGPVYSPNKAMRSPYTGIYSRNAHNIHYYSLCNYIITILIKFVLITRVIGDIIIIKIACVIISMNITRQFVDITRVIS